MKTDSGLGGSIQSLFVVVKPDSVIDHTTPNGPFITSTFNDDITAGLVFGSCTGAIANEVITLMDENDPNTYVDRQGISNANYASISAEGHIFSNVLGTNWSMGVDGSNDLRDLTSGTRHDLLYTSSFAIGASVRDSELIYEYYFDGKIGEIILVQGAVDTPTRQKIEGYLAWKWNLIANLPSDHPYKNVAPTAPIQYLPPQNTVLTTVNLVNNHWMAQYPLFEDNLWDSAAYFTGAQRLLELQGSTTVSNYIKGWGDKYSWTKPTRTGNNTFADDQCCGQIYIDYYRYEGKTDPSKLTSIVASVQEQLDRVAVNDWWWCDALYMAMPVFAKLGVEYSDTDYFDKMYALYRYTGYEIDTGVESVFGLYDATEKLWFRDIDYVYPKEAAANGSKVFWSRGNGWVFGAMARVLQELPPEETHRAEFELMFQNMAAKLITIQRNDGFWGANLLDPHDPSYPETSGTSFFTFGLAWGVNNGLLTRSTYEPYIAKAWNAMVATAVHPDGTLGWSQNIGKEPWSTWTYNTENNFAVGAFIQAGIEISLMVS